MTQSWPHYESSLTWSQSYRNWLLVALVVWRFWGLMTRCLGLCVTHALTQHLQETPLLLRVSRKLLSLFLNRILGSKEPSAMLKAENKPTCLRAHHLWRESCYKKNKLNGIHCMHWQMTTTLRDYQFHFNFFQLIDIWLLHFDSLLTNNIPLLLGAAIISKAYGCFLRCCLS